MTNTTSHTPGPWRIKCGFPYRGGDINIVNRAGDYVCLVGGEQTTESEVARLDADAILIAAAPDLLEALQFLYSHIAVQYTDEDLATLPQCIKARAAIAKATGAKP